MTSKRCRSEVDATYLCCIDFRTMSFYCHVPTGKSPFQKFVELEQNVPIHTIIVVFAVYGLFGVYGLL